MLTFTVKGIADKFNISVHTIRFYDDQGLLPDVTRDDHGTRIFTEEHIEWINLVLCLRNTGMSVTDIKNYIELCKIGDSTILERYHIILDQKQKAEDDLKAMQKRLEVLRHKETYYENLLKIRTGDA